MICTEIEEMKSALNGFGEHLKRLNERLDSLEEVLKARFRTGLKFINYSIIFCWTG